MILGNEVSLAAYNKISKTEVKEPDNNTTNSLLTRKKKLKIIVIYLQQKEYLCI